MNLKPTWENGKPYIDNVKAAWCKNKCGGWCDRSCDNCDVCLTEVYPTQKEDNGN